MKINKFEDLVAWQLSQELSVKVYRRFGKLKDFGFRDQIQRASVSVSNNIAEGFDRNYPKEFRRFLFISKASCGEVKSMVYLAEKLEYISAEERDSLLLDCSKVSKVIYGLVMSIK